MRFTQWALNGIVWIGLIIIGLVPPVVAQQAARPEWQGHFVIRELMPVVAPKMLDAIQSFVCLEVDVRSSELLPSERGGVTQSRAFIRELKPGSTLVRVTGEDPAYRIYQVYERFGVLTRVLSWVGTEHIFSGTVSFGGYTFEGDPSFPLHFKYVRDVGYVHLCGRGTVTAPGGLKDALGGAKGLDDFIGEIMAEDQLTREGASEALGWLVKTQAEKDKAVPALVKALKDEAMEVRRNAASSLGKTGDLRAQDELKTALQDKDEWVQEVVAHALKKIGQGTSESSP